MNKKQAKPALDNGSALLPLRRLLLTVLEMTTLLVSHRLNAAHGADIAATAMRAGMTMELLVLPEDREARLAVAHCARIDLAYFSEDLFPDHARQFFSAIRKAPGLKWLQVFNAGVDHPVYAEMRARSASHDVVGLRR